MRVFTGVQDSKNGGVDERDEAQKSVYGAGAAHMQRLCFSRVKNSSCLPCKRVQIY